MPRPVPNHRSGTSFKYDAFWEDLDDFREVVRNARGFVDAVEDHWKDLDNNLKICKSSFQAWLKSTFKNAVVEVSKLKKWSSFLLNQHQYDIDRGSAILKGIN